MRAYKTTATGLAVSVVAMAMLTGCPAFDNSDPGEEDGQVLYRWQTDDDPSSAERGTLHISEINWAGSVHNDGTYDPDDVFIEIRNEYHRPINLSEWRIEITGDYEQSFRLPQFEEPLTPNEHLVIAAKDDGAFGEVADVVDDRLKLGKRAVRVELRDADRRLVEPAGSSTDRPFAGGYDLVTVRSMERTQSLFDNMGSMDRSWHANTDDVSFDSVQDIDYDGGRQNIADGYRENTLASPGEPNSADYAGATAGGQFE